MTLEIRQLRLDTRTAEGSIGPFETTVEPGTWIGWFDPTPSRASRWLAVMAGLAPPTDGTVALDGLDCHEEIDALRSRIGYLPRGDVLPTTLGVERALKYTAELRLTDCEPEAREARVLEVVDSLELASRTDRRIDSLSEEARRRTNLAAECLVAPEILYLDRPDDGLDAEATDTLFETLDRWRRSGGIVVSTVSQPIPDAPFDRLYAVDASGDVDRHDATDPPS